MGYYNYKKKDIKKNKIVHEEIKQEEKPIIINEEKPIEEIKYTPKISIIQQWKDYINDIHFKIFLKKEKKNIGLKILKQKLINVAKFKELERLKNIEFTTIQQSKEIRKDDNNKIIMLHSKALKPFKWIPSSIRNLFGFDGYLLHGNKGREFTLYKIKKLNSVHNMERTKESYNIIENIGTMNFKPLFMAIYPYALTITLNDNGKLFYDSKSYYQYVNHATKLNMLSKGEGLGFGEIIRKYWFIILIIILIVIFFSTPQGQQVWAEIIAKVQG